MKNRYAELMHNLEIKTLHYQDKFPHISMKSLKKLCYRTTPVFFINSPQLTEYKIYQSVAGSIFSHTSLLLPVSLFVQHRAKQQLPGLVHSATVHRQQ